MKLHAKNVTLAVGERVLCRDLDLAVEPGELWAVLGRNGSGKTTLLHALAGLAPVQHGVIDIGGRALAGYPRRALGRDVGILLQQEDRDFWGTVADYVMLGRYPHARSWLGPVADDEAAVARALDAFDLAPFRARAYVTLSGGERQRARLAQLWAQQPQILLLDEPLQHLDLRHQAQTLQRVAHAVRDSGRAAVLVLHDLAYAGHCDKVLMLYGDGRYEAGAAGALLEPSRLERLYGCRVRAYGAGSDEHFIPVI